MLMPIVACSDTEKTGDSTKPAVTTKAPDGTTIYYEPDELPDLDFDGRTVTILSAGKSQSKDAVSDTDSNHKEELTVEELSSDIINDSIYNRELYVEDRLNVEINNVKTDKLGEEILKMFNTGEDIYDAYVQANHSVSQYAFEGFLTDLNEVENLDLDKPWWSQKFNDEAEMFDKLYLTTGSLFLSLTRNTYAVYFNKGLIDDYKESNPELAELYDLVDEGKWTFDKFVELGGEIYNDINGNSQRDLEDIYGIAYAAYIPIDAIWSGFDIDILSKTNDGWYDFDVNTDKLFTALDKLYALLLDNVGSITANVQNSDGTVYSVDEIDTYFANGTNMFLVAGIGCAENRTMRNMQDDYGLLPFPKYDEAQKEYYSYSHDTFSAVVIPITNSEPEVVGAVLEAMASYSYRETMPAYLDTVLKGQYMSDADSRRMVDIVIDGFMVDAAWIYLGTLGNSYTHTFRYMVQDNDRSFATAHESKKKGVETVLKVYKKQMQE